MADAKTKQTAASVATFLNAIPDAVVRADCRAIAGLMQAATKSKPKMWGKNIVGFGDREIRYAGGRTANWMVIGFSPRKQNITLYALDGSKPDDPLLASLGPHSRGKGCLYIKRLSDVHGPTLEKLIRTAAQEKMSKPRGQR